MQSVILAGGLGTRLLPYTMFLPKPMLPLGEKPLLEHLIEWNVQHGLDDIVICISYLGRLIENYFGNGGEFGVSIQYARSKKPLATAGQLHTARDLLDDTFVCMYGDSLYDFDLGSMINAHRHNSAFITMALHRHTSTIPYGVIDTHADGSVLSWREKPKITNQINAGCYVMEPDIMKHIPADVPWGMDAVIKSTMNDGSKVYGHVFEGDFIDVGTRDSYDTLSQKYRERLKNV